MQRDGKSCDDGATFVTVARRIWRLSGPGTFCDRASPVHCIPPDFVDNVTHTLAGLLLADAVVQQRARRVNVTAGVTQPDPRTTESARTFAWTAALLGVIGANLPDIDVPWGMLLQALGHYDDIQLLLHHRGRTHTLVACLAGIPLLWVLALLLRRRHVRRGVDAPTLANAREPVTMHEGSALLLLATVSVLSHLLLDFTNDYGVHPLSPFSNQWFYGDTIFIVEPWIWVAAIPPLLRTATSRGARLVLRSVLVIGVALCWVVPLVSTAAAVAVSVGAVLGVVLARWLPTRSTALVGLGSWLFVTACFAAGAGIVRANVIESVGANAARADAASEGDRMRLMDVVTGATPANPLCARVITVEASASHYRLTTAWASAVPQLVSAAWCSRAAQTDTTRGAQHLPMTRAQTLGTRAIQWTWTSTAARAPLATLAREHCAVAAWLQFARVPFVIPVGTDSLMVGDLRYDRDARASVARYTLPSTPDHCPVSDVPWSRPRADIWPT